MANKEKRRIAILRIEKCGECPHREVGMSYSLDGFDRGNDWRCKKANKEIVSFVERPSDEPSEVPSWCPLKTKMVSQ